MKKAKYLKKNNSDVKFDKIIASLDFDQNIQARQESRKNEKTEKSSGKERDEHDDLINV
mgnify:CR=1 FL=1|jgi:hypothetical protein